MYLLMTFNRYAFAHPHGKCRRGVILEYLGEDPVTSETVKQCCDIWESSLSSVNCLPESEAVIQAVNELPGSGEKKGKTCVNNLMCTLCMYISLSTH